ncbi:MAG: cysteine desulfurase [Oscillospiraceae bacterium]|jgi:cysteine desulfurase|nr:cysteine desulfurase [Oscillospiraceae bacterium]
MNNDIYFDNAATTMVGERVAKRVYEVLLSSATNPSSLHKLGRFAKEILENSRNKISSIINCDPHELYFTSGATESNMIALLGTLKPKFRSGRRVITTAVEHKSLLACCKKLENFGYEVIYVRPNKDGRNLIEEFEGLVDEDTALVSVMHVNNETGDVYDIKGLARVVKLKNPKTLFHCDAAQSFGKFVLDVRELGIDAMSFCGHKVGAPQGVGGLFLKNGVRACLLEGGVQEFGVRMGTENLPGIAGFAEACEDLGLESVASNFERMKLLKDFLVSKLLKIDGIRVNSAENASPYILNFSALGIPAQVMLNRLERDGIFVGVGAACSKSKESHVLKALGFSGEVISSAIRVSFCQKNEMAEIERFVEMFSCAAWELRANDTRGNLGVGR